jgi:tetratricopeptide (TPR) repeat protein
MKRSWPAACATVLTLSLLCAPAFGQASAKDKREAQKLAGEGKALIKKGDFKQAADRYERADKLDAQPSYELELARMLIELKDFLKAGQVLKKCTGAAPKAAPEKKAQADCETLAKEVAERTPSIAITVFKPEASKVKVTIAGEEIDPSEGAVAYNPGSYEVVARAGGYADWKQSVTLAEFDKKKLEITMTSSGGGDGEEGETPEDEGVGGGGISPIPAIVCWSVGGVALAFGIGFGVAAIQSTNDVLDLYECQDGECPAEAREDLDIAKTNGNVSTAMFVIGGAGIVAGTVLFFFSDFGGDDEAEGEPEDGAVELSARPLLGPGYLGVEGEF